MSENSKVREYEYDSNDEYRNRLQQGFQSFRSQIDHKKTNRCKLLYMKRVFCKWRAITLHKQYLKENITNRVSFAGSQVYSLLKWIAKSGGNMYLQNSPNRKYTDILAVQTKNRYREYSIRYIQLKETAIPLYVYGIGLLDAYSYRKMFVFWKDYHRKIVMSRERIIYNRKKMYLKLWKSMYRCRILNIAFTNPTNRYIKRNIFMLWKKQTQQHRYVVRIQSLWRGYYIRHIVRHKNNRIGFIMHMIRYNAIAIPIAIDTYKRKLLYRTYRIWKDYGYHLVSSDRSNMANYSRLRFFRKLRRKALYRFISINSILSIANKHYVDILYIKGFRKLVLKHWCRRRREIASNLMNGYRVRQYLFHWKRITVFHLNYRPTHRMITHSSMIKTEQPFRTGYRTGYNAYKRAIQYLNRNVRTRTVAIDPISLQHRYITLWAYRTIGKYSVRKRIEFYQNKINKHRLRVAIAKLRRKAQERHRKNSIINYEWNRKVKKLLRMGLKRLNKFLYKAKRYHRIYHRGCYTYSYGNSYGNISGQNKEDGIVYKRKHRLKMSKLINKLRIQCIEAIRKLKIYANLRKTKRNIRNIKYMSLLSPRNPSTSISTPDQKTFISISGYGNNYGYVTPRSMFMSGNKNRSSISSENMSISMFSSQKKQSRDSNLYIKPLDPMELAYRAINALQRMQVYQLRQAFKNLTYITKLSSVLDKKFIESHRYAIISSMKRSLYRWIQYRRTCKLFRTIRSKLYAKSTLSRWYALYSYRTTRRHKIHTFRIKRITKLCITILSHWKQYVVSNRVESNIIYHVITMNRIYRLHSIFENWIRAYGMSKQSYRIHRVVDLVHSSYKKKYWKLWYKKYKKAYIKHMTLLQRVFDAWQQQVSEDVFIRRAMVLGCSHYSITKLPIAMQSIRRHSILSMIQKNSMDKAIDYYRQNRKNRYMNRWLLYASVRGVLRRGLDSLSHHSSSSVNSSHYNHDYLPTFRSTNSMDRNRLNNIDRRSVSRTGLRGGSKYTYSNYSMSALISTSKSIIKTRYTYDKLGKVRIKYILRHLYNQVKKRKIRNKIMSLRLIYNRWKNYTLLSKNKLQSKLNKIYQMRLANFWNRIKYLIKISNITNNINQNRLKRLFYTWKRIYRLSFLQWKVVTNSNASKIGMNLFLRHVWYRWTIAIKISRIYRNRMLSKHMFAWKRIIMTRKYIQTVYIKRKELLKKLLRKYATVSHRLLTNAMILWKQYVDVGVYVGMNRREEILYNISNSISIARQTYRHLNGSHQSMNDNNGDGMPMTPRTHRGEDKNDISLLKSFSEYKKYHIKEQMEQQTLFSPILKSSIQKSSIQKPSTIQSSHHQNKKDSSNNDNNDKVTIKSPYPLRNVDEALSMSMSLSSPYAIHSMTKVGRTLLFADLQSPSL